MKTAFALYAGTGLAAALALSAISSGAFSLMAQNTLPGDPYAYSGVYIFDDESNALIPAEAISWYETSALDSLYDEYEEGDTNGKPSGTDVAFLYVEGDDLERAKPIPLDDPPVGMQDGDIVDMAWSAGARETDHGPLSLSEIAEYDAQERPTRPGFEATRIFAEQLPENENGDKPLVSNVGYYVPFPQPDSISGRVGGLRRLGARHLRHLPDCGGQAVLQK